MIKVMDGIRILDLSNFIAGPFCAMLLGSLGAEVIRIEPPDGALDRDIGPYSASGEGMYPWHFCCNKKGITLNTREEKGKEILSDLIKNSDMLIESFLPKAKKSIGLEYDKLKELNSRLIVVSFSCYGQTGPYSDRGGFDAMAQGISGMMSVTGIPGSPPQKSGTAVIDYGTALYGALGALAALRHRDKTGLGQMVDVSLLDTAVSFMETVFAEYKVLNYIRPQTGNRRQYTSPTDMFEAKNGYVNISVSTDTIWKRFLKIIGKEDLDDNPAFNSNRTRYQNYEVLNSIAQEWVEGKTVEEAVRELNAAGVPAAPVYEIADVVTDPHIRDRKIIEYVSYPGVGEIPIPGIAFKLSRTPASIDKRAPNIGEHNKDVYRSILNYEDEELSKLRRSGII